MRVMSLSKELFDGILSKAGVAADGVESARLSFENLNYVLQRRVKIADRLLGSSHEYVKELDFTVEKFLTRLEPYREMVERTRDGWAEVLGVKTQSADTLLTRAAVYDLSTLYWMTFIYDLASILSGDFLEDNKVEVMINDSSGGRRKVIVLPEEIRDEIKNSCSGELLYIQRQADGPVICLLDSDGREYESLIDEYHVPECIQRLILGEHKFPADLSEMLKKVEVIFASRKMNRFVAFGTGSVRQPHALLIATKRHWLTEGGGLTAKALDWEIPQMVHELTHLRDNESIFRNGDVVYLATLTEASAFYQELVYRRGAGSDADMTERTLLRFLLPYLRILFGYKNTGFQPHYLEFYLGLARQKVNWLSEEEQARLLAAFGTE